MATTVNGVNKQTVNVDDCFEVARKVAIQAGKVKAVVVFLGLC